MSILKYNGVTFAMCLTKDGSQEPAWDESNTDVIGIRHRLAITSILAPDVLPSLAKEPPAAAMARLKHHLMTPRRPLWYGHGGVALYDVPGIDIANGPKPLRCNITKASDGSFLIDFAIEFVTRECPEAGRLDLNDLDSYVVSHRWSERHRLSSTGKTEEYVRTGTVRTRSDMLDNPDQLRSLVVPPMPLNFKSKGSTYTLREDNLALEYTYAMEEVYLQPPYPALEVDSQFSVISTSGAHRDADYSIRLTGRPGQRKAELIRLALVCLMAKTAKDTLEPIEYKVGAFRFPIGSLVITDYPYQPIIQLHSRFRLKPNAKRNSTIASLFAIFDENRTLSGTIEQGQTNNIDAATYGIRGKAGAKLSPRGHAGLTMIGARLRDPCVRPDILLTSGGTAEINLTGTGIPGQTTINLGGSGGPPFTPGGGSPTLSGSGVPGGNNSAGQGPTSNAPLPPAAPSPGQPTTGVGPFGATAAGGFGLGAIVGAIQFGIAPTLPSDLATPAGSAPAKYNDDDDLGVYDFFSCKKHYYDNRKEAFQHYPVAKTGALPELVQVAPLHNYCEVTWKVRKSGGVPRIPDPESEAAKTGWILIDHDYKPSELNLMADEETVTHQAEGSYLFLIPDYRDANLLPAVPPWMRDAPGDYVDEVKTDKGILFPEKWNGDLVKLAKDVFPQNMTGATDKPVIGPGGNTSQA